MSNITKNLKVVIVLVLAITFFVPFVVLAQPSTSTNQITNYQPLAELPGVTDGKVSTSNIGPYLANLFNFLVGLAAILAVFIIALGGFLYISSDSFTGKSAGKEHITNAIWGLLIVLGAYIILWTINPNLLDFNFIASEKTLPEEVAPPSGGGPPSIGGE